MTEAYEQIRIRPEDVRKMTFSTIFSTFQSRVMQMGDCNAPSTFQQLMTAIFQDFLGRFVHVYLDNIFIYSQSIRERAYRAHNESASMTQRVAVLLIKIKAWFILRQNWLSGTCYWRQWHTHWIGQNVVNWGMDNSLKLQWSPKIPWTSAIPGTIHARCNGVYHTVIRISTKQLNLPVDTTTG